MKTSGISDPILPLTKKQKCASNIVLGGLLCIAGVILTLAGTGVIKASVRDIAAPTVLFAFGLAVMISAIIAKNSISMWIAGVIIACGTTSLLAVTTSAGYANLYPIYIAAPGIGCVFSVWFAEAKFPQFKVMAFFGVIAILFSLGASGVCGYGLVCGLLAAFAGLCAIYGAVESYLKKDKVNNA